MGDAYGTITSWSTIKLNSNKVTEAFVLGEDVSPAGWMDLHFLLDQFNSLFIRRRISRNTQIFNALGERIHAKITNAQ
jgi:hypothetical protein